MQGSEISTKRGTKLRATHQHSCHYRDFDTLSMGSLLGVVYPICSIMAEPYKHSKIVLTRSMDLGKVPLRAGKYRAGWWRKLRGSCPTNAPSLRDWSVARPSEACGCFSDLDRDG